MKFSARGTGDSNKDTVIYVGGGGGGEREAALRAAKKPITRTTFSSELVSLNGKTHISSAWGDITLSHPNVEG